MDKYSYFHFNLSFITPATSDPIERIVTNSILSHPNQYYMTPYNMGHIIHVNLTNFKPIAYVDVLNIL